MIKGIGTSPGHITGQVSVIHGPDEFDQMHPGTILVTKITTPAWTPLFALAAGVVTDVSGPLRTPPQKKDSEFASLRCSSASPQLRLSKTC